MVYNISIGCLKHCLKHWRKWVIVVGKRRKSKRRKKIVAKKSINQMNLQELQAKLPPKIFNELREKSERDWKSVSLTHHIFFNNFMDNENMCHAIFKPILKNFNLNLKKLTVATEKSFEGKDKGIRLDVVVEDEQNIINMEMQVKIKYMPPERIRYYLTSIDKDQLIKGQDYTELKNTFIIVVTPEDPFGLDEPVYIVDKNAKPFKIPKFEEGEFNLNDYTENDFDLEKAKKSYSNKEKQEKPIYTSSITEDKKTTKYDDGTYIIYLNASAYKKLENDELRAFLAYLMGEHLTEIDFFYVIHERVKKIRNNRKMEVSYMLSAIREYYRDLERRDNIIEEYRKELTEEIRDTIIEEYREEVEDTIIEKYRQKVTDENRKKEVDMILNMIKDNLTDEIISNYTQIPIEEISKIREEHLK